MIPDGAVRGGGGGVTVSGGGSIAVDTASMQQAARAVDAAAGDLDSIVGRASAVLGDRSWPGAADLAQAVDAMTTARQECRNAADGLRIAAVRYGAAEQQATDRATSAAAELAARIGSMERVLTMVGGPATAGAMDVWLAGLAAEGVTLRLLQEWVTTGRVQPQLDPVMITAVRLALSSIDDLTRARLGIEKKSDIAHDDPASDYGSQSTAATLALLFGLFHPASKGVRLNARTGAAPVQGPGDLASLVGRVPSAGPGGRQIRIERYVQGDTTRWIVYIAGTVTFDPLSGSEPFDMTSNLEGIAHRPSDSETAVIQAMHDAGVQPGQPVLLVGHSQGALDAVRVAQDGGFDVGGVVQVGGPSGQIALPASVPVLSAEHEQDLVPVLGGVAATGAAGLNRIVVSRSLPDGGAVAGGSALENAFPAHQIQPYEETLRLAEQSGDPRVDRFVGEMRPFLDGADGQVTMVRADRIAATAPAAHRESRGR